ncbi:F-type H+-transporting ATPase subunit gamma [Syntrophus gentianae]|uniref:F-type H+-transporting ATPase subunit gamma n=1 Tax=Syntrophus gentianae TaxID=43775 RepID=A0A1H7VP61_9BACT|nr:F0F1 ATP synthase subunit gamma [Syntrophus gentianae]SEM10669.1 F-type H+-transporting ATPase subunit gamma [Syntrophus gentianae]
MQTSEVLKRKISTAQDLQSVVRTMKSLAAVSIRQYQKAVESLNEYKKTLEMGLQIVLKDRSIDLPFPEPKPPNHLGAIIFGSDQGLCGPLNALIASHALQSMEELGVNRKNRTVLTIGMRLQGHLEEKNQDIFENLPPPSSVAGITSSVQEVLLILEEWRFNLSIDSVILYYHESMSGFSYRPCTQQLLPVDLRWLRDIQGRKWQSRTLPIYRMGGDDLFAALVREHLFVSLYRALAESSASENASRLATMQSAEKNIGDHLDELGTLFHRQRQSTITEELLDILAGFEVLNEKKSNSRRKESW